MDAIRPGMVVRLDAAASVQFVGRRSIFLRVTAVNARPTYHGWVWLTGYQLNRSGDAVRRREVYVRQAGVIVVPNSADPPPERGTDR